MEHFSIVQALCRAAIAHPSPAVRKQIERLRDALQSAGDGKRATRLRAILKSAERNREMSPSQLSRSRAQSAGEELTPNTQAPVDRETAAPLAELIFPDEPPAKPPVFDAIISEAIQNMLEEWDHIEALSKIEVFPARSCLIYGEPGTGKTRLALWIASQLNLPVVLARLDGLVSSFLGTTARNIGNLFSFTERYRCLLLLDEFDAVAKLRDDPHEVGEIKRVVNALLQNLDKRRETGFTIGATNHPALLDPAVWRRFEVQLELPKPTFDVRVDIAQQFLPPLKLSDPELRMLTWFTEGATGAEVEILVRTYKKATAIYGEKGKDLIATLQQFATLNSGRISSERKDLIFGDSKLLLRALRKDPDLELTMAELGEITGRDKSTISRQLAKSK